MVTTTRSALIGLVKLAVADRQRPTDGSSNHLLVIFCLPFPNSFCLRRWFSVTNHLLHQVDSDPFFSFFCPFGSHDSFRPSFGSPHNFTTPGFVQDSIWVFLADTVKLHQTPKLHTFSQWRRTTLSLTLIHLYVFYCHEITGKGMKMQRWYTKCVQSAELLIHSLHVNTHIKYKFVHDETST